MTDKNSGRRSWPFLLLNGGAGVLGAAGVLLGLPLLGGLAGGTALLSGLLFFFTSGFSGNSARRQASRARAAEEKAEPADQEIREARKTLGKLEEREKELASLREEGKKIRYEREAILHSYRLVEAFIPRASRMADIIFSKGEESSLVTSRHISRIGKTSRQVGSSIQVTLGQMLEGDDNLHTYVDDLMAQTGKLAETDESFKTMGKRLVTDMAKTREAVTEILGFSEMIADLADRTNILAINASIEAARVGNAGKGFSVIAGEVQKLSRNSFDLSEKIQQMSREINDMMESTFHTQEEVVDRAVAALDGVRASLESVSTRLHDRVHEVGESIEESRNLSQTVIEEVNRITVVLQSQDINRQVLEHIIHLLKVSLERGREGIESGESLSAADKEALKKELQEMARGVLSVEEEFAALDMTQEKGAVGKKQKDLEGEIELF